MSDRGPWPWVLGGLGLAAVSLPHELMDVDCAQYADVARRMVEARDGWTLVDMNGPFLNKPPLFMQLQALAMWALGPTSLAARLPAWLSVVAATVAVSGIGRQLWGPWPGLRAGALFACSVAAHHMVADPKVDGLVVALVSLAVWAMLAGRTAGRWTVAGWLLAGLAVSTKGPVGAVMVAGAVGPALVTAWRARRPVPPGEAPGQVAAASPGWWPHLLGAGLFLAWLAFVAVKIAEDQGPRAVLFHLWEQGVGRLLGASPHRDRTTPLYVVHTGLWAWLPCSLLAGVGLWRRLRAGPWRLLDAGGVPALWLLTVSAGVALSTFKLPQYVYWAAPPAALLAASALDWRGTRLTAVGLGVASALLGAGLLWWSFPSGPLASLAWLLGLGLSVVVAARARELAVALAASTLGFLALYHGHVHPELLRYAPSWEIAEASRHEPAGPLQLLDVADAYSLAFYTHRRLAPISGPSPGLTLASDAAVARLDGHPLRRLGRWPRYHVSLPRRRFLLASSREAAVEWLNLVVIEP